MKKRHAWQRRTPTVEKFEGVLAEHFPAALCRVYPAKDGKLRILVIDDRFIGQDFFKKRDCVLKELYRANKNAELTSDDMNEIGSIDVFSPLELV
jgi:hypothetical protein